MKQSYLITYTLILSEERIYGQIRVKNKDSELQAKIHLEVFFKKKYPDFVRLIIRDSKPDVVTNLFGIFGMKK